MLETLRKYFDSKMKSPCKSYDELLEFCKNVKEYTDISYLEIEQRPTESLNRKWCVFFHLGSKVIDKIAFEERQFNPNHLKERSFEYLKDENRELHIEKLPESYKTSFANPQYSVKQFGKKIGQLNCFLYTQLLNLTGLCHQHYTSQIEQTCRLFCNYFLVWYAHELNMITPFVNRKQGESIFDKLFLLLKTEQEKNLKENLRRYFEKRFSPQHDFYVKWIKNTDLEDLRYLFFYGNYVSENEIKTAEFLNTLPQQKIDLVMHQTAKAFIKGFDEAKKDYSKKKTVTLHFRIGMERLARSLIQELENRYGLKVLIPGVFSGNFDQQFQYDHRFANALFLDKGYADFYLSEYEAINDEFQKYTEDVSGGIYFESFGEKPFSPTNKTACLKYTEDQLQLSKHIRSSTTMLLRKYYKNEETSFCIIGFPTPDIGKHFTEIFDKTIDINMLSHDHWLQIQQYLIDVLDTAEKVQIKGCKKNKTDIVIKLPKLANPKKETNFGNCGATVNIPVGEVFTTPQLKGTNGLLHLPKTFLSDLLYKDLEIEFKDGWISRYDCKNYKRFEDNKKYIEENLIFPHKTLPIGEFAIGTNTLAYSVAKKYKILPVLPILIIEKMGPHFAIGDTCYYREEDVSVFNPDGKEIISRDNEHSIIRKSDPLKAYFNVHTDITLPYDEIGSIKAIKKNGESIDIIKDGKFVLKGTTELNKYL